MEVNDNIRNKRNIRYIKSSIVDDKDLLFLYHDILIIPSKSYYVSVKGRFDIDFALNIESLSNKNIRLEGGNENYRVIDWLDFNNPEKYSVIKELEKGELTLSDLKFKLDEIKKRLLSEDRDSLYVSMYHIDTKDALIKFLSEYNKYNGYEFSDYKENLKLVNNKLLKDTKNVYESNLMINSKDSKLIGIETSISSLINEFDNNVNPFLVDKDYIPKKEMEYTSSLTTNGYSFKIIDNDKFVYFRSEKKVFGYQVRIDNDKEFFLFAHSYGEHPFDEMINKEHITMTRYIDGNKVCDYIYNIDSNMFGDIYNDNHIITDKDKKIIIEQLKYANSIAKNITSKEKVKSL